MRPILNMVKAIEFVSPHEVDVVFEANGEIFKRRALLAAGNKAGGGSADWCWLVWDMTAPALAQSQLGWIRLGRGTPRVKGVA